MGVDGCSLTPRAAGPDAPAMLLDNLSAEVEAKSHPGELPIVHVCSPPKALEDVRHVVRGYANAVVGHREVGSVLIPRQLDAHLATARAVLHGIFNQIVE